MYLPTHELLTIYPGFLPLYDAHHLEFEETWRDTCALLGAPALRGPRASDIASVLAPLEEAARGTCGPRTQRSLLLGSGQR